MSIQYCDTCGELIDTDWCPEHFDEDGKCVIDEEEE
tara:strand:+ start:109 stop:216 length:108 start_codon:yes stop_codon:yes gene_type:complete